MKNNIGDLVVKKKIIRKTSKSIFFTKEKLKSYDKPSVWEKKWESFM